MVPKIVMKLYIDCCELLSEQPNLEVLRRLYNLEVTFTFIFFQIKGGGGGGGLMKWAFDFADLDKIKQISQYYQFLY